MNPVFAAGVLHSAIYLVAVFAAALVGAHHVAMILIIASMGLTYLYYAAHATDHAVLASFINLGAIAAGAAAALALMF